MEGGRIMLRGLLAAILAAVVLATAGAPGAGASLGGTSEPMLVQPDGKIVVTGPLWPSFAALARLTPDGRLDQSFGSGGFVVDRRLSSLTALAQRPDGRIVAAGVGGFRLAQYLPNGEPDPGFAGGGVGGTDVPSESDFIYSDYGPNAIVLQPGGEIVVAGTESEGGGASSGLVRRYDANGSLLETVGRIPRLGGEATFESHLDGLLANPDGSLIGAGWTYVYGNSERGSKVLLARFVPGAGGGYDPSFGAGAGLVREGFGAVDNGPTGVRALARDGDTLLVAGRMGGSILVSRFSQGGILDKSFGQNGYAAPAIAGSRPPSGSAAGSWANSVAPVGGGSSVVAGGTSMWSKWRFQAKVGPVCEECPQPLLARFTPTGQLDPGFGDSGVLRLLAPDGGLLEGEAEQVAALADGKLLIRGTVEEEGPGLSPYVSVGAPFVARLNPDGSYDPSFGDGGLTVLALPCHRGGRAELREQGCYPGTEFRVQVSGRSRRGPRLSFEVGPTLPWARVSEVELSLPPGLRLRRGFESRTRAVAVGGDDDVAVHRIAASKGHPAGRLLFHRFGQAEALRVTLLPGALRSAGPPASRRSGLRVTTHFVNEAGLYAGWQTVVRRVGSVRR